MMSCDDPARVVLRPGSTGWRLVVVNGRVPRALENGRRCAGSGVDCWSFEVEASGRLRASFRGLGKRDEELAIKGQ